MRRKKLLLILAVYLICVFITLGFLQILNDKALLYNQWKFHLAPKSSIYGGA